MKPVTLYVSESLYEKFQLNAEKQGRKTAELIREAMESYAEEKFAKKKSVDELIFSMENFGKKLQIQSGKKDFLDENNRIDSSSYDEWEEGYFENLKKSDSGKMAV